MSAGEHKAAVIQLSACALSLVALCTCGPIELGDASDFASGFESGDFSEWSAAEEGPLGKPTLYAFPGGSRSIVSDPVQRGRHAAKLALALDDGKQQHVGFLVGGLPPTAYYSAWFLWPRSYSAAYWVIFHLRQATSDDTRPDEPLVALSVQGDGTTMNLALLYTDALLDPVASSPIALPIGRWVHLLMRYENRGNEPGRVTVWQDDVKILSREDVPPATFGRPYWNVGSIAEVIEPAPAEVFLDEVAIAPERTP